MHTVDPGAGQIRECLQVRREPTEPLAYSVTDAASASGLGRSTLYDLMAQGQLDYVKVRARRLITRQALEALLERHRAAA